MKRDQGRGWRGVVLAGLVLVLPAGCQNLPLGGFPLPPATTLATGAPKAAGDNKELPRLETARVCLVTADALFAKGKDREAISLYEKARVTDPSQKQVCRRLAVLYDRQGDFQRSMTEYHRALELTPDSADLHNDIGYSFYCRGRWDQAEKHLRKAVELAPQHRKAWCNLALTLGQQAKYEEARAAFEKAVPPGQAQANLGFLLAAQGKYPQAKEAYQKALQLDPDLHLARAALKKLQNGSVGPDSSAVAAASAPKGEASPSAGQKSRLSATLDRSRQKEAVATPVAPALTTPTGPVEGHIILSPE
jgi:tetratricopeptide (TPR) repeat protein